jgi:cell division septal protein FtsQ
MAAVLRLVRNGEHNIDISADTVQAPRMNWATIAAAILCLVFLGVWVVGAVAIISLFL